jgi:hypothetical protein
MELVFTVWTDRELLTEQQIQVESFVSHGTEEGNHDL